jgi:hypothetical protein
MASRALILQQKTQRPVQFEITEPTRDAVSAWIKKSALNSDDLPWRLSYGSVMYVAQRDRGVRGDDCRSLIVGEPKKAGRSMPSYFSQPSTEPLLTLVPREYRRPRHRLPKNTLQGHWRNRRRYICEVESPSAKVAEPDKFRCSDFPFRQAMSLRLEPHLKFIIGTEDSEALRLRLGLCVGKRRGSIHSLR